MCGQKVFGSQKKFRVKKLLGSKKVFDQKFLGSKIFLWSKKFVLKICLDEKKLGGGVKKFV